MKTRYLINLLIALAILAFGCKKKSSPADDPCNDLVNESAPTKIMVKFIDKTTGLDLIISKQIKASDISVANKNTGKDFPNWQLMNQSGISPYNGMLQLSVFDESAAQYNYQIKVNGYVTLTLAYAVTKTATNDRCKPFAYPVSDIKITDHAFTTFS